MEESNQQNNNSVRKESFFVKISLWLSGIFGSFPSLVLHSMAISLWLYQGRDINTLTLFLSIEAIYLSLFILTASNIEMSRDRRRTSRDLKIDQKALKRLVEVHEIVSSIEKKLDDRK